MKITDEAVHAAVKRYHDRTDPTADGHIRDVLTAALPYLNLGFDVKKLDWVKQSNGDCSGGDYLIYVNNYDQYVLALHDTVIEIHATVDQAKAAAQADFERRILSAIIHKPVDVATVLNSAALVVEGRSTAINSEFIESLSHRRNYEVAEIVNEHDLKLGAAIRALSPAEPAPRRQGDD